MSLAAIASAVTSHFGWFEKAHPRKHFKVHEKYNKEPRKMTTSKVLRRLKVPKHLRLPFYGHYDNSLQPFRSPTGDAKKGLLVR